MPAVRAALLVLPALLAPATTPLAAQEPAAWAVFVRAFDAYMPYQRLLFAPGARYSYSNPGILYLARVVEQITGDPWVAYVQKNVAAARRLLD